MEAYMKSKSIPGYVTSHGMILPRKKFNHLSFPPKKDNFDQKNINEEWKDLEDENFKENAISLKRQSTQDLFAGYYYDYQVAAIA